VLDLDFSKSTGKPWSERLIDNKIIDGMSFTHVVEIQLDDEEVMHRARNIRQNVQTGQVYSQWERDELRRPKPPKLDDDGNPIEEEEEVDEDGNPKKKIPAESELVSRACDESGPIVGEIDFYKDPEGERKAAATFIQKLFDSTFIKLDAAGMTPTELCDVVTFRIKPKTSEPLRPIAKRIEDKSDPKSLLEDEGDEEAGILPRRSQWSLWRKTDPVALLKGQVEEGQAEFAVHYANNVFMFKNEENMNAFIENPRKFVSVPPSMPPDFRILLLGPRGVGKKTQAQMLSEFYGWRVVNFVEVVQKKLAQLLKMRVKPPNNFVKDGKCMICMSQEELDKIKEGHSLPAWKFLPWILEFLGVPMKRRPIVPKLPEAEPNVEEMTPEELKAYQLA